MWWNKPKAVEPVQPSQEETERTTRTGTFEEAARAVQPPVAAAPQEEETDYAFVVEDEDVRAVLKACFWPLAKWDHAAWKLTDDEAERIRPKMEPFLQRVADRYAPDWLAKFQTKHIELYDLTRALAAMYFVKFMLVRRLKKAEADAAAKRELKSVPIDRSRFTGEEGQGEIVCEVCGVKFPDAQECARHLPCLGKSDGGVDK